MPLYEYQCQNCDTHFERIEKVSSPTDGVCPTCGSAARRLLGAPALQFKGSGWYVNDYGKGNGGTPASTAESKHESTSETSSKTESSATSESSAKSERAAKSESAPKSNSKVA
jgi:putative FmdB family regulatory protein